MKTETFCSIALKLAGVIALGTHQRLWRRPRASLHHKPGEPSSHTCSAQHWRRGVAVPACAKEIVTSSLAHRRKPARRL